MSAIPARLVGSVLQIQAGSDVQAREGRPPPPTPLHASHVLRPAALAGLAAAFASVGSTPRRRPRRGFARGRGRARGARRAARRRGRMRASRLHVRSQAHGGTDFGTNPDGVHMTYDSDADDALPRGCATQVQTGRRHALRRTKRRRLFVLAPRTRSAPRLRRRSRTLASTRFSMCASRTASMRLQRARHKLCRGRDQRLRRRRRARGDVRARGARRPWAARDVRAGPRPRARTPRRQYATRRCCGYTTAAAATGDAIAPDLLFTLLRASVPADGDALAAWTSLGRMALRATPAREPLRPALIRARTATTRSSSSRTRSWRSSARSASRGTRRSLNPATRRGVTSTTTRTVTGTQVRPALQTGCYGHFVTYDTDDCSGGVKRVDVVAPYTFETRTCEDGGAAHGVSWRVDRRRLRRTGT